MSTETSHAFGHPEDRAAATAGPEPLDRIMLRDHLRSVEIGAFQAERGVDQRLRFNLVVEVRSAAEGGIDDVDRILSYDTLVEAIDIELAAERLNLLETLAARVADRILAHPLAARCFVRIEKLDRGPFALGVEIVRCSKIAARLREVTEAPRPRVIYLSRAAVNQPGLAGFLDKIEAQGGPVILCVGPSDLPVPQAEHPLAQRRIDLLAIEQTAWVLAARDARCVVVDSRTELDWAMKQGKISVWAPSKMVLDAVDGPDDIAAEALAVWLATSFEAQELVLFGGQAPQGAALPIRLEDEP